MTLVKLPGKLVEYGIDEGHEVWVNPEYVTSVTKSTKPMKNGDFVGKTPIKVEFEGNSGYRTRGVYLFDTTLQEVVDNLNGAKGGKPAESSLESSRTTV